MKAEMVVERPEDVRVKLTITMTVGQWEVEQAALNRVLKESYHHDVAALRDAIGTALHKIKENVSSDPIKLSDE